MTAFQEVGSWWDREVRPQRGFPVFRRLWGLARHIAGREVCDDDLFDLVVDATLYCMERFDEARPPRKGLRRRTVEDRFAAFFSYKMRFMVQDLLQSRHRRLGWGNGRYRGPRGETHELARQPRSKARLYELLHGAVAGLGARERQAIELRYWHGATLREVADALGLGDHSQARRELDRACAKLRALLAARLQDVVIHSQDDYEPVPVAA